MGNTFTLSDDLLNTIATLLQLAILTGTDIYDNLQTIQVVMGEDSKVHVSPEFKQKLEEEIARLAKNIETLSLQTPLTDPQLRVSTDN